MAESGTVVSLDTNHAHRAAVSITASIIIVLAAFVIPFDRVALPANAGFMPAFGSLVFIADGLTAVLLIVQSRFSAHHRLRELGATYLFSGAIILPHLLAFPGVFAPTPVIGGADTAIWLWCFWHGGFAVGVLRFVLMRDRPARRSHATGLILGVVALVALSTVVATLGLPWLPTLLQGGNFNRLIDLGIGPVVLALTLAAAILVLTQLRCRDPVSAWLWVAMVAATLDVALTLFGGGRFTLGWYSARVLSLITGLTVLFSLLSELVREAGRVAQLNGELEHLLCTDVLTRVANRRAFDNALASEWRRASREATPLSLLIVDVDFFKGFNDRYGHPAGDDCLRRVAGALREALLRPADMAARVGGEEFGLLLPVTDQSGAWQVAQRVRDGVVQLGLQHESSAFGHVTVSIGVATVYPNAPGAHLDELVHMADRALYDGKTSGRNAIRIAAALEGSLVAA